MKRIQDFDDGEAVNALICFTDIVGFSTISKGHDVKVIFNILKDIAEITTKVFENTAGTIVKYIGDSSLLVFPEESVDEGVQNLLDLKEKLEVFLGSRDLPNKISFACHFGEIVVGKLPPFDTVDISGDAVNIAAMLDRGHRKGKFVISSQVFRKLNPETRKRFHKFTPPIVYLST